MLDTVKINHVQHISFTQSRLTDAVSVILSELLSYEHPPNGAAVFMGAVLRARERPGAFAPLEHFAEGKISPQGGFTPPEDIKKTGSPPAFTLVGRDCPPMAQEKAIAAAKALAEEG